MVVEVESSRNQMVKNEKFIASTCRSWPPDPRDKRQPVTKSKRCLPESRKESLSGRRCTLPWRVWGDGPAWGAQRGPSRTWTWCWCASQRQKQRPRNKGRARAPAASTCRTLPPAPRQPLVRPPLGYAKWLTLLPASERDCCTECLSATVIVQLWAIVMKLFFD